LTLSPALNVQVFSYNILNNCVNVKLFFDIFENMFTTKTQRTQSFHKDDIILGVTLSSLRLCGEKGQISMKNLKIGNYFGKLIRFEYRYIIVFMLKTIIFT